MNIMLLEWPKANGVLGNPGGGSAIMPWKIAEQKANLNFWHHSYPSFNWNFVDGHAKFLSYESTFDGTSYDPWNRTNVYNSMWDCHP